MESFYKSELEVHNVAIRKHLEGSCFLHKVGGTKYGGVSPQSCLILSQRNWREDTEIECMKQKKLDLSRYIPPGNVFRAAETVTSFLVEEALKENQNST